MGESKRRRIISHTNRLSSGNCLNCGVEIDSATSVGHRHQPRPGSIAICIVCSHIMAYDENIHLREMTDEECLAIAGNPELLFLINGLSGAKAAWEEKHGKGTWGAKARERLARLKAQQKEATQ
jgi:hypothetical protein